MPSFNLGPNQSLNYSASNLLQAACRVHGWNQYCTLGNWRLFLNDKVLIWPSIYLTSYLVLIFTVYEAFVITCGLYGFLHFYLVWLLFISWSTRWSFLLSLRRDLSNYKPLSSVSRLSRINKVLWFIKMSRLRVFAKSHTDLCYHEYYDFETFLPLPTMITWRRGNHS